MVQPKGGLTIYVATSLLYVLLGNEIEPSHGFSSITTIPSSPLSLSHDRTTIITANNNSVRSHVLPSSCHITSVRLRCNHAISTAMTSPKDHRRINTNRIRLRPLSLSDKYDSGGSDSNRWISSDDDTEDKDDWQEDVERRQDGSLWSSFEPDPSESSSPSTPPPPSDYDDGESFLDAIAAITADEIEFMNTEADRADKARQMQEWGFDSVSISSTLGVATDGALETEEGDEMLEKFRGETAESGFGMYLDEEVDLETVESHSMVPVDEETGAPARSQMVYVDEHACIGCYNCATVAQSTFFMEAEQGRARVFQQWGDDDETVQIAIETCPVDCIHYIPYEELVRLEVERRDQNINSKARLVGGESGPKAFSRPPKISGNMGSRCNNCPSRGCAKCPMYGVGKNPAFEKREKEREERAARKRIRQQRESTERSAEL